MAAEVAAASVAIGDGVAWDGLLRLDFTQLQSLLKTICKRLDGHDASIASLAADAAEAKSSLAKTTEGLEKAVAETTTLKEDISQTLRKEFTGAIDDAVHPIKAQLAQLDEASKDAAQKAGEALAKASDALSHTPENFQETVDHLASLQIQMNNMVADLALHKMELEKNLAAIGERIASIADDMPDPELPSDVIRRSDLNSYDLQLSQLGQNIRVLESQLANKADVSALSLFSNQGDQPISESVHAMVVDMHAKVIALNSMTTGLRSDADKSDFEIRTMQTEHARLLAQHTALAEEYAAATADLSARLDALQARGDGGSGGGGGGSKLSQEEWDNLMKSVAKRSDFESVAERLLGLADSVRQVENKLAAKVDSSALAAITTAMSNDGNAAENVRAMLIDLHTKVASTTESTKRLEAECGKATQKIDELSARVTKDTDSLKQDVRRIEAAMATTSPDVVTRSTLAQALRPLVTRLEFEEATDRLIRTAEERGRMLENRLNERVQNLTLASHDDQSSGLPFLAMYKDLDIRIRESQDEIQRVQVQITNIATRRRSQLGQSMYGLALSLSRAALDDPKPEPPIEMPTTSSEASAAAPQGDPPADTPTERPTTSKRPITSGPSPGLDGSLSSSSFRQGAFSDKMDIVIAAAVEALNARVLAMEALLKNQKDAPAGASGASSAELNLLRHDIERIQSDLFGVREWMARHSEASTSHGDDKSLRRMLSEQSTDNVARDPKLAARVDALAAEVEQMKNDRLGNAASQLIGKQQTALQDMTQRLAGMETSIRRHQSKMAFEMKQRVTRADFDAVLKQMGVGSADRTEARAPTVPRRAGGAPASCQCDPADPAVLRRPVPSGFHCISCDRHVDIAIGYPRYGGAAFEARGMRGATLVAEPVAAIPSIRSCGGAYTNGQMEGPMSHKEGESIERPAVIMHEDRMKTLEIGVVGSNGKVYKGRKRLSSLGALPPIDPRHNTIEDAAVEGRGPSRSTSRPSSPDDDSASGEEVTAEVTTAIRADAPTAEPIN
eukprot:Opistho-1_new@84473